MLKQILFFLLLVFTFISCQQEEEKEEEKAVPVKIYKISPESISSYIKLTGSVTAENDAIIFSKISEKLVNINVKPGTRVKKDQVLAVQYNETFKQAVELSEAMVKSAQAQIDLMKQEFERMEKLYNQKAVSQQQYDQTKTQKETAEAGLEQAKSQLNQTREQFENSFIKAPFDGIVAAVFFEKDQMLPAGQPVMQIVTPGSMKAKLKIPSKDIRHIKIGQKAEISFPSLKGEVYHGRVAEINEAVDQISKLLEIEIQIEDADSKIKSGIFGEFRIETISLKDKIVIPETAVLQQTEIVVNKKTGIQQSVKKYFVFITKDGSADLIEIKTGISSNGRIEVTEGLNISDSVVVVGQNVVRKGQTVNVVE
ncbi:MAG: efflux RND transporter periplasmic adaptor subunit [Melioribacteraceae bacterium]|nr:efflux RND transporter periplasmic adaptor subunit [Melioribacteraceae bacterium]MCF8356659.1 efflux RND transporter periplasmic adaptor subunit [Melioribacteraceae bacterium]MCF8419880.1 efflux RND transporter periplasmic adaptor subunit [Melioribacteraceae bacterium]